MHAFAYLSQTWCACCLWIVLHPNFLRSLDQGQGSKLLWHWVNYMHLSPKNSPQTIVTLLLHRWNNRGLSLPACFHFGLIFCSILNWHLKNQVFGSKLLIVWQWIDIKFYRKNFVFSPYQDRNLSVCFNCYPDNFVTFRKWSC